MPAWVRRPGPLPLNHPSLTSATPDCRDCNFSNSNLSTAYFMKASVECLAGYAAGWLAGQRQRTAAHALRLAHYSMHAFHPDLCMFEALTRHTVCPFCQPLQSVLARANFENADLSDTLMDRSVIVEANLRGAVLQVRSCCTCTNYRGDGLSVVAVAMQPGCRLWGVAVQYWRQKSVEEHA